MYPSLLNAQNRLYYRNALPTRATLVRDIIYCRNKMPFDNMSTQANILTDSNATLLLYQNLYPYTF